MEWNRMEWNGCICLSRVLCEYMCALQFSSFCLGGFVRLTVSSRCVSISSASTSQLDMHGSYPIGSNWSANSTVTTIAVAGKYPLRSFGITETRQILPKRERYEY